MAERIEIDMGWWRLDPGPLWRLSWCPDDGWLRLYRAGGTDMILRLARYELRGQMEADLDGWEHQDGDARWLVRIYPALRTFVSLVGI